MTFRRMTQTCLWHKEDELHAMQRAANKEWIAGLGRPDSLRGIRC